MEELQIEDIDDLSQNKPEILENSNEIIQDDIENLTEKATDTTEEIINEIIDDIDNDISNNSNLFTKIEHINNNDNGQSYNQETDVINDSLSSEVISNKEIDDENTSEDNNSKSFNLQDNPNYQVLLNYGENLTEKEYVTNPAIGRDNEIKQLIVILLTPEKSGILVGKPGIGKTAIVEGLSYKIKNGDVPNALKDYTIFKLNSATLTGTMPGTNELKVQYIVNNLKNLDKIMVFIDEIHTLIGNGESMDFANIFKPVIDRGGIKIIGATTSDEYDRYILKDKAFVRRFQKIEVAEPTREMNIQIMMGSYQKFEKKMNLKLQYSDFIKERIMAFLTDITSEFKRVYEISARYPDISLTILQQAFSYAAFDNRDSVNIRDVRKAISTTKLIYPDVINKELIKFNEVFKDIYLSETKQILKDEIE